MPLLLAVLPFLVSLVGFSHLQQLYANFDLLPALEQRYSGPSETIRHGYGVWHHGRRELHPVQDR
jgi:hypothetical protein